MMVSTANIMIFTDSTIKKNILFYYMLKPSINTLQLHSM